MSVISLVNEPAAPQLEFRHIDSLVAYGNNARTHSKAQLRQIRASVAAYGWTNAVLADGKGIVAGHGRVEAARAAYKDGEILRFPNGAKIPEGMVPVVDCSGWSPEQRKAYILADNQLALNAGWDEQLLHIEVVSLQEAGFDLELLGFSDEQLADILAMPDADLGGGGDPDAAPPAPEVPHSQPGDVWILGPHRVCCGSATSPDDWHRLMAGERADACWTDPPYNVDMGRKNRLMDGAVGGGRAKTGAIENDKMAPEEFEQLLRDAFARVAEVLKAGAPVYVAHSDKAGDVFRSTFAEAGLHFSQMLIWKKNVHVVGMADFQPIHEPILYGWKPGSKHRWYGGRKQKTVIELGEGGPISRLPDGRWQITVGDAVLVVSGEALVEEHPSSMIYEPKPSASKLHPTMKPVALVERMLKNSARRGDLVVDAFGGSGTTLIAADRMGMSARLMELDPRFVDVIVLRWQELTGRTAVHAETGAEFPVT